jgi:type II secretory pathway pseudopilin PulG
MVSRQRIFAARHRTSMKVSTRMSGFSYIGLLVLVSVMGIGLGATGVVFHHQAQREKEKQLLYVGEQFRRAIGAYFENSPGGAKRYPRTLADLLHDDRHTNLQRYLRRIYVDPMTGSADWVPIVAADGTIMGVHSAYAGVPVKNSGFPPGYEDFKEKNNYTEWIFQYVPDTAAASR